MFSAGGFCFFISRLPRINPKVYIMENMVNKPLKPVKTERIAATVTPMSEDRCLLSEGKSILANEAAVKILAIIAIKM